MLNPKVRPWVALSLADPDRRCGTKFSCDFLKCKTYRAKLGIFFSYPPSRADKLTYNAGAPNEKILLQVSEVFLRHKCPFSVRFKGLFLNAKKNVSVWIRSLAKTFKLQKILINFRERNIITRIYELLLPF